MIGMVSLTPDLRLLLKIHTYPQLPSNLNGNKKHAE
jgi:hypothetical protein